MDAFTVQQILAQQQAYMGQAQAYSHMVGAAARGYQTPPSSVIGALGGPTPIPGAGAGLSPGAVPDTHRIAGMGAGAAGAIGMGGLAALTWGSMSMGFRDLGHSRMRYMAGILDPISSAAHGFMGSIRASAISRAGMSRADLRTGRQIFGSLGSIHAAGGTSGLLRTIGGAAMRAGVMAAPALAIGGAAAWGVRQVGAGAGQWNQTASVMREIAPHTGMGDAYSSSVVNAIENDIGGMMDMGRSIQPQRTELMGLMRTAGAAGEFGKTGDVKQFSKQFKKLVSETRAVAKLMDSNLSEAYGMMRSFKGLGYTTSRGQMGALAAVSFGAKGAGLSSQTIMTGMATGVQAAPAMGMSRRGGAEMGLGLTTGIGSMLKNDSDFAARVFESTGLSGDKAAYQLSSQWMGMRAGMRQNPMTQMVMAAVADPSGGVDEWKLQRILGGGMTGKDLQKAAKKALKDKRIASVVASRGNQMYSRMMQIAGPERLATTLSGYSSDITGFDADASMMGMTGMGVDQFSLLKEARGGAAAAATSSRMEGLGQRLESMQLKYLSEMIDPRNIISREWNKLKNPIEKRVQDVGRELMHRATSYIEERTSALRSQILDHNSPQWNAGARQAWSGGGVSNFVSGATSLMRAGSGLGSGATSIPVHAAESMGMTGSLGMPLHTGSLAGGRAGTMIGLSGGGFSGATITPFSGADHAWSLPTTSRANLGVLSQRASADFYQQGGDPTYAGTALRAMGHPMSRRMMYRPLAWSAGHMARGAGNAWAGGMGAVSRGASAGVATGAVSASRYGGWRAMRAGQSFGQGVGALARAAGRTLGVVGMGVAVGYAGWDTWQYGRDTSTRNKAIDQEGWYGFARGAFDAGELSRMLAPTPELNEALRGKLAKQEPGFGDYAGVFASSFMGGATEWLIPGSIDAWEGALGVDRGKRGVREVKRPGRDSIYLYGPTDQVVKAAAGVREFWDKQVVRTTNYAGAVSKATRRRVQKAESISVLLGLPGAKGKTHGDYGLSPVGSNDVQELSGLGIAEGAPNQDYLSYTSAKYGPTILLESQLSALAGVATTNASSIRDNKALYGVFRKDLRVRSKAWNPEVLRKIDKGIWDAEARGYITTVDKGAELLAEVDRVAASRGGITPGDAGKELVGTILPKMIARGVGAGLGKADIVGMIDSGQYRGAKAAFEDELLLGNDWSLRNKNRGLLRRFQTGLAEGLGSGAISKEAVQSLVEAKKPDGYAAAALLEKIGMQKSGISGLGVESGMDLGGVVKSAIGWSTADMMRQGKGHAQATIDFAKGVSSSMKKANMRGRLAGLGFQPGFLNTMNDVLSFYDETARGDASDMATKMDQVHLRASNLTRQFGRTFGAMDVGAQELARKHIASSPELQGTYGVVAGNISMAQSMGTQAFDLRKKKGREVGKERMSQMESMLGASFGAHGLSTWGLGMKDPNVTLELQQQVSATLQQKYGAEANVGKVSSLITEYMRTGGGTTEKDVRKFMSNLGQEVTKLGQGAAAPQSATAQANTQAIEALTRLLQGTDGADNVFKGMIDELSKLRETGFAVQVNFGDVVAGNPVSSLAKPTSGT